MSFRHSLLLGNTVLHKKPQTQYLYSYAHNLSFLHMYNLVWIRSLAVTKIIFIKNSLHYLYDLELQDLHFSEQIAHSLRASTVLGPFLDIDSSLSLVSWSLFVVSPVQWSIFAGWWAKSYVTVPWNLMLLYVLNSCALRFLAGAFIQSISTY